MVHTARNSSFPEEYVSPETKSGPAYGLQYAQAAFHAFSSFGFRLFHNAQDEIAYLTELAQGRQSLDPLRKALGYVDDTNQSESFAYLDLRVLNYAQKLLNNVQGRLRRMDHDVTLTAVDPLAESDRRSHEAKVKAYMELREWMQQVKVPAEELFTGLDLATLPEEPDELLIDMQMNYQHRSAMKAEIRLKKLLNKANDYQKIKKQRAFDLTAYGVSVTRNYLDKNGIPRMERIHPANFICSHATGEDFDDMEYAGHVEYISASQFRREASPFLAPDQIRRVIDGQGTKDHQHVYGYGGTADTRHRHDNLTYLPVFRFQFLTENQETYDVRHNAHGNKVLIPKQFDYEPSDEIKPLYLNYGGDRRELIRNSYTCKYGGTWVVGSDVVYDYAPVPMLEGALAEPRLDYIVTAPNMQEGRVVSLLAQMQEPLELINLAYNKAKEILADGFMGMLEIDVRKLEQIPIGKGGKNFTPREVLDLFFKTKILYSRSVVNAHEQSDGRAVSETNVGLSLADYLNTMRLGVETLRDLCGITPQADGQIAPGDLVGNTKFAVAATETTLDYLTHAMQQAFRRECECLLLLAQISERTAVEKGTESQIRDALGHDEILDGEISLHQFAILISPKPTEAEWQRFYASVDRALAAGSLSVADAVFLYRIDNLKQAEQVLVTRQRKRERDAARQAQSQMEANQQAQMESNRQATEREMALLQNEYGLKMQLEEVKLQRMREMASEKYAYQADLAERTGRHKLENTRTAGANDLIRQAQRNKVELLKVEKRPDRSPAD